MLIFICGRDLEPEGERGAGFVDGMAGLDLLEAGSLDSELLLFVLPLSPADRELVDDPVVMTPVEVVCFW